MAGEPVRRSGSTDIRSNYSLDTRGDDEDLDVRDATETTGLLGAGAESGHGAPEVEGDSLPRKDSWEGSADFDGLPWWRRPSIYWLVGPYALFTLAYGGSIVPKLNLIIDLICKKYFREQASVDPNFTFLPVIVGGDNPQCTIPAVQKHVATFMLGISVIVGILSAFTAPKLGALSDRYGRKRLLALTSFGGLIGEGVMILAGMFPEVIDYRWLIVGAIFDGLSGSFTAGSVLGHSYTSDCTPPSKRGVAIGYLHSCLFSGLAFGPLLAGYFVKWTGSLLSIFYVTFACHAIFILFILFVLPESLSKKRQLLAREKHALKQDRKDQNMQEWASSIETSVPGPLQKIAPEITKLFATIRHSHPFEPLKILFPKGPGAGPVRRNLCLLALIDMIILGAAMSSGQVTLLYTEFMFHWGNFETSAFMSLISMVRVFVLMGILPILNYFFRVRPQARRRRESGFIVEKNAGADQLDCWVLRVAIVSDVVGICGYTLARSPPVFVLCGIVTAFGGLGSATIQAALSKHVSSERVGELLGAIGLLHALSRIIAPVIFNGLYAATVESFPQAIFVLMTALFVVVLVLSMFIRPHLYLAETEEGPIPVRRAVSRHQSEESVLTEEEVVPRI